MNPTTDVFEQRIAALEGGSGALAVASGQAAETLALLGITQVGDEIVSANNLYGGTYQLFHHTLPKLGRTVKFVDSQKPEELQAGDHQEDTRMSRETIGNPSSTSRISKRSPRSPTTPACRSWSTTPSVWARQADRPRCRPRGQLGERSTSAGTAHPIGGVIVDSGKFAWNNGKFRSSPT